jgi:hypothetical protein
MLLAPCLVDGILGRSVIMDDFFGFLEFSFLGMDPVVGKFLDRISLTHQTIGVFDVAVNHGEALLLVFPLVFEKAFLFGVFFCGFFNGLEEGEFGEFLIVIFIEEVLEKVVKVSELIFVEGILFHGLVENIGGGFD